MQVGAALEAQDVKLRGAQAANLVIMHYDGLSLYPAADQMQGEDVDCAAYLVPISMMAAQDQAAGDE
jgi:hypothetical protein